MRRKWWIAGGLILLEVLVCAGIVAVVWSARGSLSGVRFFYVTDTRIEETVEETFEVDGPATLDLESDFGDVVVLPSDGDQVEILAQLDLWGADEEDARQQIDLQMSQEGDTIIVRTQRPSYVSVFTFNQASRVDFEIRVPDDTTIEVALSSGDVEVRNVNGTMTLETDFGSIEVDDTQGLVHAQSSSGDITLTDLSDAGDTEVSTDFGTITIRNIEAESLTAQTDSGTVSVLSGEIDGSLDLESSFGDVSSDSVTAASYRLHSSSGDLTLHRCSGTIDLNTDFGSIEVSECTEAILALTTSSGDVTFSGSLSDEGPHRVESDFGDVQLTLPKDAAFDLDADTDFGSIETNFAVTTTQFDEDNIVGEVNGGGPLLRVVVSSGDITIESSPVEND